MKVIKSSTLILVFVFSLIMTIGTTGGDGDGGGTGATGTGETGTGDTGACVSNNSPPEVVQIVSNPSIVTTNRSTILTCTATDTDLDDLTYTWACDDGFLSNIEDNTAQWTPPEFPGSYECYVTVSDGKETVEEAIRLNVNYPNRSPLKPYNLRPADGATNVSTTPTLIWECSDPDGDPLVYDITFGLYGHRQLILMNHPESSFSPGVLQAGEKYTWGIKAKDDHGHVESSAWYDFTVGE